MKNRKFTINAKWRLMLNEMDLDITYLLHTAGLPLDTFTRKDAALDSSEFSLLLQTLERLTDIGAAPIYLGKRVTSNLFSPAMLACLSSVNLENAMQRLAQYEVLISPINLDISINSDNLTAEITSCEQDNEVPTLMVLYKLVVIMQIARIATKRSISPEKITLKKMPPNLQEYRQYFSAPILKADKNTIVFSHSDTIIPFYTEDNTMWQYMLNGLESGKEEKAECTDIVAEVKQKLFEILPSGLCSLDSVARGLAMSKRTLQRKLKAESVCFQEVLDKTRLELAEHYLMNTDLMVVEISYLTGYLDHNAFQRAFKKWTGLTPHCYKNQYNGSPAVEENALKVELKP